MQMPTFLETQQDKALDTIEQVKNIVVLMDLDVSFNSHIKAITKSVSSDPKHSQSQGAHETS